MNIDSIKEIMDGFDPAALLPDLTTLVGKVEFVTRIAVMVGPIVLLVLGVLYFFASPKEANYHFGYRCYFGMGSMDAWRFTQRLAGLVLAALGLILTVVMLFVCGSFRGFYIFHVLAQIIIYNSSSQFNLHKYLTVPVNGIQICFAHRLYTPFQPSGLPVVDCLPA